MIKNNKKTKIILIVVLVLNLVLIGLYAYSFFRVKIKNEKIVVASQDLEKQLDKEGEIGNIEKIIKDTKKERKKLNAYFVTRDDIVGFTQKIESLGRISNTQLTITDLKTQDDTLSFRLSSKGKFADIVYLISLIENLPFKLSINKAYINKISGDSSDGSRWNGNLNVVLHGFSNN